MRRALIAILVLAFLVLILRRNPIEVVVTVRAPDDRSFTQQRCETLRYAVVQTWFSCYADAVKVGVSANHTGTLNLKRAEYRPLANDLENLLASQGSGEPERWPY